MLFESTPAAAFLLSFDMLSNLSDLFDLYAGHKSKRYGDISTRSQPRKNDFQEVCKTNCVLQSAYDELRFCKVRDSEF